jgi:3-oxoacyl-[acyl-carrier-protein] synthase II
MVTSWGLGLEPVLAALAAGEPRALPLERLPGLSPRPGAAAAVAAHVREVGDGGWLAAREARRMSPPSRSAVVACRMALADAGLALPEEVEPRGGVVLASAFAASSATQTLLDQLVEEGPEGMSPFHFMESVANAPAGQAAIHCRAGGVNLTLCQREAGPPSALGRGAAEVAAGRARWVLAGAVEEVTPLLYSVLERFGAVSAPPRPFDRRRRGYLAAEGATVLLLEPEAVARARGAPVRARVRAWGGAFDPTAGRTGWGSGAGLAARIARGLARAGLSSHDVAVVVSGASGSRGGDRVEAAVLRDLFGAGLPPVLAPKGVTGEYAGGYLAAALAVLAGRPVAVPLGFGEADPALGVTPAAAPGGRPAGPVLITAFAAGGSGAWVILETP